jgi:pimeloyl-ACP methyl ester carboxylesterase
VIAEWQKLARLQRARVHGVLGQLLAAARHDTADRLHRIRAKTLVVTGDADRMIPPENSGGIAGRIPGARLRILPGAAHDFPTERASETAELLRKFLLS